MRQDSPGLSRAFLSLGREEGFAFVDGSIIRISLKYSHTLYWGKETTGTGYEERRGNTISEMGAQFDLNL